MKNLDEQIDDIEKLDALRQQARKLRQEAVKALTGALYVPRPRELSGVEESEDAFVAWKTLADRPGWDLPGDDVEKAEVLRALSVFGRHELKQNELAECCKQIIDDLAKLADDEVAKKRSLDNVPFFRYAMVLQALAKTPGQAFSKTSLYCYDKIIAELEEATDPDWMMGAARASPRSEATAFVTGECARALLALEDVLCQTAEAADLLGKDAARQTKIVQISAKEVAAWRAREEEFRTYSLKISLKALPLSLITSADGTKSPSDLLDELVQVLDAISNVPPGSPETPADQLRQMLKVSDVARAKTNLEEKGRLIGQGLRDAAASIRGRLRATEQFAKAVINREIASADQKDLVDAAELVFAATLLGVTSEWKRPKIGAAFGVLRPLLSTDGRLLSIRPFDVFEKGYRLNAATLGIAQHIAQLLAHASVEPDPEFIERLLLPFDYTRAEPAKSGYGWTTDPPPRVRKSLWWLSAVALDALDTIVRMLDATINRRILRNFQVRQPEQLNFKLDDLFYPDYGLATYRLGEEGRSGDISSQSVAVTLQRLRAHAARGPVEEKPKPLYSLILYGPPGTGKSTLVEAIAHTANVPLVEITPSDILVGGAEGMERRAREVFQMLAMLTHVVILFDEFDSILLDRSKRDPEALPTSVVEFLTPGMLPKLKALNNASKQGRISYVLATNFVDRLDSAATRSGRFDQRHGLFPPDALSRLGRLRDQLARQPLTTEQIAATLKIESAAVQDRLASLDGAEIDPELRDVVSKTKGGPMDKIGRKGWFTMPGKPDDIDANAPFGAVLKKHPLAKVETESTLEEETKKYKEQVAKRLNKKIEDVGCPSGDYWDQWQLINGWDSEFSELKNWSWSAAGKRFDEMLKPVTAAASKGTKAKK